MAFSLSRSRDQMIEELEDRAEHLQREIARLKRGAGRQVGRAYGDASDFASDLYQVLERTGAGAGTEIARGARRARRMARDNPTATAIVGAAAIGFLITLLMRR